MSKAIDAKDKSVREILSGVQYSIDFYQRDYKWQTKQVDELVADLTSRFLDSFQEEHVRADVASYPSYFLGSIVLSQRDGGLFIVDGQQRLTTLTLLLIYLRNLQISEGQPEDPNVQLLIQSTQYGAQNFNMSVPERTAIIEALYNNEVPDSSDEDPSTTNILFRYQDIEATFPDACKGSVLPYFMDWLVERVQLVEICARSDEDAYTVFETMNDRGLSLGPSDMLKGYLLSSIRDIDQRDKAEETWNKSIKSLSQLPQKDPENEFFRSWFRGRFASTYGLSRDDYERFRPEFHRWLRDNAARVDLNHSADYFYFVSKMLPLYAKTFRRIRDCQLLFSNQSECVYYVGEARLDDLLLMLAPVSEKDPETLIWEKILVVARYLDIFIYRRVWSGRILTRPSLKSTFIALARELRNLNLEELTARLYAELTKHGQDDFDAPPPRLSGRTKSQIQRLLARLTSFVEVQAGPGVNPYPSIVLSGRSRFDIEHIWPNRFDDYREIFADQNEFLDYRSRLGSLLLIPHSYNNSYNNMPTSEKLSLYARSDHHLLVASLSAITYVRNPSFKNWLQTTQLDFEPYDETGFTKQSSDNRLELYRSLARMIWDPELLIADSGLPEMSVKTLAQEVRSRLNRESAVEPRRRSFIEGTVSDLIARQLISAGDLLVGNRPGVETAAVALVMPDGSLELENGERFEAPSTAAMSLGLTGTINGWDFWVHQQSSKTLSELRAQLNSVRDQTRDTLFEAP